MTSKEFVHASRPTFLCATPKSSILVKFQYNREFLTRRSFNHSGTFEPKTATPRVRVRFSPNPNAKNLGRKNVGLSFEGKMNSVDFFAGVIIRNDLTRKSRIWSIPMLRTESHETM